MPPFINLIALASLALFTLSSAPVHVNALVADRAQVARQVHGHNAIARRKRSASTGSCVPKPSSSLATSTTPPPTSAPPPPTSTPLPPTSTTPSTTSSAPSPTSGCGPKKWGLAWNADPSYLPNFSLSKVGYLYDWAPTLPSNIPSGILGIPMLWGPSQTPGFSNIVIEGYSTIIFALNEPNEPSQVNMSPTDAINFWVINIQPLKALGYKLIAPPCTDDDAGLTWYSQFFPGCHAAGCTFDGIAIHAYNTDPQVVISYVTNLYQTYGYELWITEFADENFTGSGGQASMSDVWNFAGTMVDFVDNTPWVCGAFPFGVVNDLQGVNTDNALLGSDGYPTALAYYYFGNPTN